MSSSSDPDSEADLSETLAPGTDFASYVITRVIGQGAFGAVYEAMRQPLGKRVALKVLHRKLITNAEVIARFIREAQTTAQIRHPSIVETFDVGEHRGAPYLAMEFLEGEPLDRRLRRERPLPVSTAVDIMLPVLSAMVTVHDRGIVHRDLKPENLFLARGRGGVVTPKVLDFGIAKVQTSEEFALTRTTALLGTPYYMSPEQARESKHITAASDQWALGVILYECLTGRRPFSGNSLLELLNAIATAEYTHPARIVPELPPAVVEAVVRALKPNVAERFVDVRAFARELLPFASPAVQAQWGHDFDEPVSEVDATRPIDPQSLPEVMPTFAMSAPPQAPATTGTLTMASRERDLPTTAPIPSSQRAPRTTATLVSLGLLLAVGGAWIGVKATDRGAAASPTPPPVRSSGVYRVQARAVPATAALTLDDNAPRVGVIDLTLPRNGRRHRLVVSAPGYRPTTFEFNDHFSVPEIALSREEPAAPVVAPVAASDAGASEAPAPVRVAAPVERWRRRPDASVGTARQRGENRASHSQETGSNGVPIR